MIVRIKGIYLIASVLLLGCSARDTKLEQYIVEGEQLYNKHCSNCHQSTGKGLGLVYPPVDRSDYMDANFNEVICLMKYGKKGELVVNGKKFNQAMPGVPSLTELELAEIATFLYNYWDRKSGLITIDSVAGALKTCED